MRRKKLIFSLICILTLFFIFSFFFVEKNHSHECHTLDCEICEQILNCERKLNELKQTKPIFSMLNNFPILFFANIDFSSIKNFHICTLISLKIELLA